jgi:hypothetical protein
MRIKKKLWQKLKDVKDIEPKELYWLKLENGDIVLSAYIPNQFNAGWACLEYVDGVGMTVKSGSFYLVRNAEIQHFKEQ